MTLISLTGPGSHHLTREPGVGNVVIGPQRPGAPRPDLIVDPDDPIDWTVFHPFTVPSGDSWPRRISYEGDDTGFVHEEVEAFDWTPHRAHDLNAAAARTGALAIHLRHAPLRLIPPPGRLAVAGDLSLFTPAGDTCPSALSLAPDTRPSTATPVTLPPMPTFSEVADLDVRVPPLRQPFDCTAVLQFPNLRSLALSGSLTNLNALAQLPKLTSLQLRYCPDLSALPTLDTWPALSHVIAWNVEASTGRRLTAELRRSTRPWHRTRVSQLRKPEWFTTEYGLPFAAWPPRSAKAAIRAYRAAEAEDDLETAVRTFVQAMNRLSLETTEREDVADAVSRLSGKRRAEAQSWLDQDRNF